MLKIEKIFSKSLRGFSVKNGQLNKSRNRGANWLCSCPRQGTVADPGRWTWG